MPTEAPAAKCVLTPPDTVTFDGRTARIGPAVWKALRYVFAQMGERRGRVATLSRIVWGEVPLRETLRGVVWRANNALRAVGYPKRLLLDGDWLELG